MVAIDPLLVAMAWLGTYLLHSSLLLLSAWGISRSPWLRAPRSRERLWKLALLGGFLTASVQIGTGTSPILGKLALHSPEDAGAGAAPYLANRLPTETDAIPSSEWKPSRPAPQEPSAVEPRDRTSRDSESERSTSAMPRGAAGGELKSIDRGDLETRAATRRSRSVGAPTLGPVVTSTAPGTGRGPQSTSLPFLSASTPISHSWKRLVLGTWSLLGILGLCGFLWAWSRLIARIADRREVTRGPLIDELEGLRGRAGVRRRVRLFASPSLEGPITYGWLGHRICVPLRCMTDLSPAQQSSMLAHELAHAIRRDPLWFSAYSLIERLFFFQPLNRLARRELHDSAELLCDDWAVRWTGERLALASCLTEIAEWILGRRPLALPAAGMAAHPSRLGRRVERLLDDRRSPVPEPRHRWWSPASLSALTLVALAAPGVSSSHAEPVATRPELRTTAVPAPADTRAASIPGRSLGSEHGTAPGGSLFRSTGTALALEYSLLDAELGFLRDELDALRAEFTRARALPRFAHAFHQLEDRIEQLHEHRDQLTELIALVPRNSTRPRQPEPSIPSKGTLR